MSDLIDRQAAIDAFYDAFCYAYCDNCEKEMDENLCGDCHRKYQNWSASKKIIEKVIHNLPSAQTEIILCKDCKYYTSVTAQCEIRGKGLYLIRGLDDFCSKAERRPDE